MATAAPGRDAPGREASGRDAPGIPGRDGRPPADAAARTGGGSGAAWPAFLGSLALIAVFGFSAWALRGPLDAGFDKVWSLEKKAAPPAGSLPPDLQHQPAEAKPKPRQWTVGEIAAASSSLPGEIEELVREGQQELRELKDPGDLAEAAAQERARNFLKTWSRTFANRVKLLRKKAPPIDQCAPLVSLVKSCRALDVALDGLARAANMTTVKAARTTLEQTAKDLQLALAPPVAPVP